MAWRSFSSFSLEANFNPLGRVNLHTAFYNKICMESGAQPVWPDCSRPHMTRSTAAFVCAATAILQPFRGVSLSRSCNNRWIAATSSIDFPVPKGPWMMHRGLHACINVVGQVSAISSAHIGPKASS